VRHSLLDLAAVKPEDIDFAEMANALSKIARFNGINAQSAFSVAQHSVMGADSLHRETGDALLAGYFLLHDGHEYVIGDITRPAVALIDHHIRKASGKAGQASLAKQALAAAKAEIVAAIFAAAKLPPLAGMAARQVGEMDERMCAAEAHALFGTFGNLNCALPPPKLIGAIRPWGALKAEEAFVDRLRRFRRDRCCGAQALIPDEASLACDVGTHRTRFGPGGRDCRRPQGWRRMAAALRISRRSQAATVRQKRQAWRRARSCSTCPSS
jgi:uncharacterized protein